MGNTVSKNTDRSVLSVTSREEDILLPETIRPQSLQDFIGQKAVKDNLKVFVESAKTRLDSMDHTIFFGPPGLGKTTLAHIIAKELGVGFRSTSGPIITKAGDLAALLTNLQRNDVLFIDEIHRLNSAVEEVLYPAMEDFQLDILIGEGPSARCMRIDLPPFTLVAATTRSGLIGNPLRDRFGILLNVHYYSKEELMDVVLRAAKVLKFALQEDGALEIAKRSRGTPRVATRLLRRVRDFCCVAGDALVGQSEAGRALIKLDIDKNGLDKIDRMYLGALAKHYGGGPVGVENLSAALGHERDVIEEVVEPFLLQQGLLQRTPRGRILTSSGWKYLGYRDPPTKEKNRNDGEKNHDSSYRFDF